MTENSGWPTMAPAQATEVEITPTVKFELKYQGQPETEDPEAFRMRRNAELEHWLRSKHMAVNAVTNERDLRAKVTGTLFPNPVKGTQRYDLGAGYKVKLVHGLTYTLGDKDAVDGEGIKVPIRKQAEDLETVVAALGDAHRTLFEQLITWEPKISGSLYEKLDKDNPIHVTVRDMISEHLTIKPGSPTLEFEQPKESE
jgi:hypothetical protein